MQRADLNQAILLAATAFEGRTDRQGRPYIAHAIRVMNDVESHDAKVVAMLHDVFEWGSLSFDELFQANFPKRIVDAVDALTDRAGETLAEHVARIRASKLAVIVKYADIRDNSQGWRLAEMTPEQREQLLAKYRDTAELLGTTLHEIRSRSPKLDTAPLTMPRGPRAVA